MYDLIVIGGGPAGVTAALRGCELGASVALIERDSLGGVEAVILSTGWLGNLDGLNLAAAGVETDGRYVGTDSTCRTSAPHIYAAGDPGTGRPAPRGGAGRHADGARVARAGRGAGRVGAERVRNAMTGELVRVVRETVQPEDVSVWLKETH
jgi:pyruvate/2-oxoglutarate dehydrogenase complex dihydrolipoamide dehydrogenase (E3) component